MILSSLFGAKVHASVEGDFWAWFQKNENMLFNFESNRETIFNKLSDALTLVDPNLTFEFGPIEDSKREFIISANGIKDSFPSVESLFNSAPNLNKWILIKYRQRRSPLLHLTYEDTSIKPDEIYYNLYKDGDKLGIVLFFDNYTEEERVLYANIGYLYLDQALGEYDVETKLGFIEFHNKTSKYFEGAKTLRELAPQFDSYFSQQSQN